MKTGVIILKITFQNGLKYKTFFFKNLQ